MLKVLFAGFKYEYGRSEWGLSNIEYRNFFGALEKMQNVQASFFAVDEVMKQVGREAMSRQLINIVQEQKPDLLFTMIFQDEIKKDTISFITNKTGTKTFNWFTDDHWRLPVFSRFWASLFTMVGTTDSQAPKKYAAYGIKNVIKTQWGVNQYLYRPKENLKIERLKDFHPVKSGEAGPPAAEFNGVKISDISFVGKKYGNRGKYIRQLISAGLPAQGYGKGWGGGVVDFETMLEIFSQSKVNLNFTESPYVTFFQRVKLIAKMFVKKQQGKYRFAFDPFDQLQSAAGAQRRQIKARIFEIPALAGFLLSQNADNLRDYYEDGKEIVIFKGVDDMIEKCKYYLSHNDDRVAIAAAGFKRTLREQTYEQRFLEIFKAMELM